MDLTFTDEQQALRDGLARYLDRTYTFEQRQDLLRSDAPYSADVWQHFAELGLTALPFDEDAGGIGGSIADVVAISEIFGEYLNVEPYATSVLLGGGSLAAATSSSRATELINGIIAGELQVGFAHEEGRGTASAADVALTATVTDGGYRLTGRKELVIGGGQATALVVTARLSGSAGEPDGVALLLVETDAPGVSLQHYRTLDGRAAATVQFTDVPAELLVQDFATVERVIASGIVALAAEAVGAMNALLRTTVEYGATRQQFGVPIGSFQALAHRMANMKMAYLNARATLLYTTALVETGRATQQDIAVLKAQVGRFGRAVGESAVQVHGGIGTTDELSVGHYLKRILAVEAMFGQPDDHLRGIGRTAGIPADA